MLPANRHLLPVIGIDIHMIVILGAPVPIPHPFIGLVFDPMDWVPKIGATVNVNNMPRGNSGTDGMLGTKSHIPMGGPFALAPTIGHDSKNFFGSLRVKAEGALFTAAGFMVMTCNDVGVPLSLSAGKKFKPIPSLYLPTSATIPIPGGKPVIVGGPYVPDLMGMIMRLAMSFGFSALMKIAGPFIKKALTKLNDFLKKILGGTNSLSNFLCKHGFEPVNLITGSVLYEGLDFELPGAIPIKWERRWYSDSSHKGMLGHGTHLSYDLSLHVFENNSCIGIILPDGRVAGFPFLIAAQESYYHRQEKLTLTCRDQNFYELFDHKNQLAYSFQRLYDNVFKPVSLFNLAGQSITFFYDEAHFMHKMVDTAGRELFIISDSSHRVIKVEGQHDGSRRTFVEYSYNSAGDLTAITDANHQSIRIRYQNHLMVEKTDRDGQTFFWEYDGPKTGARCVHTYGDGGLLEGRIEYREGYNIVTNSLNEQRIYFYDECGLCVQEKDAYGNSVFHEYTDFFEPYRTIDEEGNITGYTYDSKGNLTAMHNPDGSVVNFKYDASGKLEMATDAMGINTVYVHKNNALKAIVRDGNSLTSYEYNPAGLIKTIIDSKWQKTLLGYDEDHNLIKVTLPDGTEASWEYDAWGRCLRTSNAANQSQNFKYDLLDRVTEVKKFDGTKVHLKYNTDDKVVRAEEEATSINFEYTALGKLKCREEGGKKVVFNYDTEERLISLISEHIGAYRFSYDRNGKVIQQSGFDGLIRNYHRDKCGKILRVDRPGNKFTRCEYDLAGRLVRAEYSDGSWEIYNYNRNGQLMEAVNENSHIIIKRDSSGRVIKEDQDGFFIESSYDELGKRIGMKSSLGAEVAIERNEGGLVNFARAINHEGDEWEARVAYNTLGQEIERLLPGNISSKFDYEAGGRPTVHTVQRDSSIKRHRLYSWNANDRLQSVMDRLNNGMVQFGHDDFGNLAWAKYEDQSQEYRLPDKAGNLHKTEDKKDRKYGPGGRLLENKGTKYTYDEEGNLVKKVSAQGDQWSYEWAGNGLLKSILNPDGHCVTFEYDALGRRTAKIYKGVITRWVWDGNNPLHEWTYLQKHKPAIFIDNFGEITKDRAEPVENLTSWIFEEGSFRPAAKMKLGNVQSIITDYAGTPVEMYDAAGEKNWGVEYNIHGKIRKQKAGLGSDCPFRYQGQYEDVETGLYYNRFRYYSPDEGLYLSQDPIQLRGGSLNLYSYVKDVNSYIDPFGLECDLAKMRKLVDQISDEEKKLFKCKEFAESLKDLMKKEGIEGEEVFLKSATDKIWSDSAQKVITENGDHVGIKVGDHVFDNLNPHGVPYSDWLTDLGSGFPGMNPPVLTPF